MNTNTPVIRLGLFALTGAIVLGTAALHSSTGPIAAVAASSPLPTVTLGTITVRPAEAVPAPGAAATEAWPVLPTIRVTASEEEVLAARIDPSDRIQILATITVQPSTEEVAAAMNGAVVQVGDGEDDGLGDALARAVIAPHRLRLDMPYYSFGKALTRSNK